MKFLLDTDHISILQWQTGQEFAALSARLAVHALADFAVCVVSFHEQVLGCHTYISRARTSADVVRGYQMLDRVLDAFATAQVLPFDAAAAVCAGLVTQRVRLAVMDLRIAAVALSQGLVLLTRNQRDFGRVPALLTEDWTL